MSDLRDFTPMRDDSAPRFVDESFNQPIRHDAVIVDDGGLGDLHIKHDAEDATAGRSKLFAGLAVAVVVGIGGAYGFTQWQAQQPVVADNSLPTPSAPTRTAAMTPPAPAAEPAPAMTPTPDTAPTAPDVAKPAPMTRPVTRQAASAPKVVPKVMEVPKSSTTTARNTVPTVTPTPEAAMPQTTAPAMTPAPVENQAANVPEPVSPTPPTSSVAGNPALNQQSAEPQADADQVQTPAQETVAPAAMAPQTPAATQPEPDAATVQPDTATTQPAPASPAQ